MSKQKQPNNRGFEWIDSPFGDFSEEELEEMLVQLSRNANQGFKEAVTKLESKILDLDPKLLLSSFAFYGLTYDGITPEQERHINITQHHVELIQAFTLMHDFETYGFHPIVGNTFKEIFELTAQLSSLFHIKRFEQFSSKLTAAERQKLSLQEHIRMHTQTVRNWGYPEQIIRTVVNLFEPLDALIHERYGLTIRCLVSMCSNIVEIVEERINKHSNKLKQLLKHKRIPTLVNQYWSIFLEESADSANEFFELINQEELTVDQVKALLLSHSDLLLPLLFEFKLEDFVIAYPQDVNIDHLKHILNKWSISFGELHSNNIEHFFMGNPVWDKPVIKLDESSFFCPVVGMFVSFCLELMENVIREDVELWEKYLKRRSDFLEEEISKLFTSRFSHAKVYTGSQWSEPSDDTKIFENDILVIFDTTAFVIEAKSGKLRSYSRRGAPSSLADDIEKLITDASLQANRFIDFLKEHNVHSFKTRRGHINNVDVTRVKYYQPLSITLDVLGAIGAHSPSLQGAGLVSKDIELASSMSLADLEIIFEIINTNSQTLHYLRWRTQLEKHTTYLADEIDLVAIYATDRFHEIRELGKDYVLYLYGESEIFNPYFLRHYHQHKVVKPTRKFTKWWTDILERLEERRIVGWTELSIILLELPFSAQKRIEKSFMRSIKKLRKESTLSYTYKIITNSTTSIILLGYRNMSFDQRNNLAAAVLGEVVRTSSPKQVVIVGLNADAQEEDYPYSFIALPNPNLLK